MTSTSIENTGVEGGAIPLANDPEFLNMRRRYREEGERRPKINSKEFGRRCFEAVERFAKVFVFDAGRRAYVLKSNPMGRTSLPDAEAVNQFCRIRGLAFSYTKEDAKTREVVNETWNLKAEFLAACFEDAGGLTFDEIDFAPGAADFFVDSLGRRVLNAWAPSPFSKAGTQDDLQNMSGAGAWMHEGRTAYGWFEMLVGFLTDYDEAVKSEVLNFIAHIVQRPWEKPLWGIILTSEAEGVGKNLLSEIVQLLTEGTKKPEVTLDNIMSPFNDWLEGRLWAHVDEVYQDARDRNIANRMKTYLTADTILINRKNIAQYSVRNCARFFLTSNAATPMALSARDRRWMVVKCSAIGSETVKDEATGMFRRAFAADIKAVHKTLNEMVLGSHHALHDIWTALNDRDISRFDPKAQPLMTAAKDELQAASDNPVKRDVFEVLSTASGRKAWAEAFQDRWAVRAEIDAMLETRFKIRAGKISGRAFGDALRSAGFLKEKRGGILRYRLPDAAQMSVLEKCRELGMEPDAAAEFLAKTEALEMRDKAQIPPAVEEDF